MISRQKLPAVLLVLYTSVFGASQFSEALAQRVALHATQQEINIWNQRRVNGPYLDDWNRIKGRADAFRANPDATWSGQTTASCNLGNPTPTRDQVERVRDAAFVYLLTRDTSYSTPVRIHLLNQAAVAGTNFNDATRWCANSEMNNVVNLGPWLRRLVYAYDYIKPTLSASEKTTLDAWFLSAGNYLMTKLDLRIKVCFPKWHSNDFSQICGAGNIAETHYNGNMTQNFQGGFSNQETAGASAIAAIAVVLDDSMLKSFSVLYVKSYLKIAVFPDGTVYDQVRWKVFLSPPYDPGLGYAYATVAIGSLVSMADHLQRAGESIYEFSTSEGVGNTVGGPKSVGLVVKRAAQMQQHVVAVYGSADASPTECERIDDYLDRTASGCSQFPHDHRMVHDMSPMAVSNIFYKDSTVATSYSRTPPANPTCGGYDCFSGDWGNYPGARFMFGQMEGKVWPYSADTTNSPPAAPSGLTVNVPG
jgi:hypothetical protein